MRRIERTVRFRRELKGRHKARIETRLAEVLKCLAEELPTRPKVS